MINDSRKYFLEIIILNFLINIEYVCAISETMIFVIMICYLNNRYLLDFVSIIFNNFQ